MIHKTDLSISFARANLLGFVFPAPVILLLLAAYLGLWGWESLGWALLRLFQPGGLPALLFWLALLTVVHEALHGFGWAFFSGLGREAIRFGFAWKTLTPYTHCKAPIGVRAYRIGGALPGLLTGLLPALVGLALPHAALFLLSLLMIFGAGGDMLSLWLIRRVPPDALIEDHPSRVGCYVIEAP